MNPDAWIALIGQTLVLIVAIIAATLRTERRITTVETKVEHLEAEVQPIPGISRAVARLEGKQASK